MRLWRYLSVSALGFCLVGCDNSDAQKIYVHDFYSQILNVGAFPQPINKDLKNILQNSDDFGLVEYAKFDMAIERYCSGEEEKWTDYVRLAPLELMSILSPGSVTFSVLNSPEQFVVKQLYAANTCKFEPVETFSHAVDE